LAANITRELNNYVALNKYGKRTVVTKRNAMVLQLIKRAFAGDIRALRFVLEKACALEPKENELPIIVKSADEPPTRALRSSKKTFNGTIKSNLTDS
jgi:hypothetical protein